MMKHKDFAVFILSHGRANRLYTYKVLKKLNYTGKIFIIIDNEDVTAHEYYAKYGADVIVFDKKAVAESIDAMDNFHNRKAIVYARNANFEIAKQLGIKYFLQLDDDYTAFKYRINKNLGYENKVCHCLDELFDAYLDFMIASKADAVAMAQGGDFIGGGNSSVFKKGLLRKCMNTWFLRTENPIIFTGTFNEDYTASVYNGGLGLKLFTVVVASIKQVATQSVTGGMTDTYLNSGTYVKSFYSVMKMPSCVKVAYQKAMGRMHHLACWNNAVPKIIEEKYKYGETL